MKGAPYSITMQGSQERDCNIDPATKPSIYNLSRVGTDTGIYSQTLGKEGNPEGEEERVVGVKEDNNSMRKGPTESAKLDS